MEEAEAGWICCGGWLALTDQLQLVFAVMLTTSIVSRFLGWVYLLVLLWFPCLDVHRNVGEFVSSDREDEV